LQEAAAAANEVLRESLGQEPSGDGCRDRVRDLEDEQRGPPSKNSAATAIPAAPTAAATTMARQGDRTSSRAKQA
jgi:hypothetical protein